MEQRGQDSARSSLIMINLFSFCVLFQIERIVHGCNEERDVMLSRVVIFVIITFLSAKWMMRWTDAKIQRQITTSDSNDADDADDGISDGMDVFTREWWRKRMAYLFNDAS